MLLSKVTVQNFKSIDNSGEVSIDDRVTVLVGQNEAGKTAFLQALEKARPARQGLKFDVTEDYPRKALNEYRRQHEKNPAPVVTLGFRIEDSEAKALQTRYGVDVLQSRDYSFAYKYDGSQTISFAVNELAYVKKILQETELPSELATAAAAASTLRGLVEALEKSPIQTPEATKLVTDVKTNFAKGFESKWHSVLAHDVLFQNLSEEPKLLFFGDYQLLPGKVNLPLLDARSANPAQLTDEDQTVLRLLRMAGVELKELLVPSGYEEAKARLEALSNSITDQIFEFWTQNRELDVEFDVRSDPTDKQPPYNNGPNLYIRIKNRRHRVTVPFNQRSKGFIWFFSFIVWFESVKAEGNNAPLILLLDEPGLSLHALAQSDLLRYIDRLGERHQILYTTHSPFMVHGDRLHQVRLVEDRTGTGTVVTDNLTGSDPKTLFPLQAALGYTIAQNLFISKRNLLVEGPADLVYLRFMAAQLESSSRSGLREDITIVPVGGLDKLATFIALLRGNALDMVVLHDLGTQPDARIASMVREKVIRERSVLNYGMFRRAAAKDKKSASDNIPTDIEDLFSVKTYVALFNSTFERQLGGSRVSESDLPDGERIIDRIERYLIAKKINLRPSGGFNHYSPASHLAGTQFAVDAATLERFEALFIQVNALFAGS